ncbi:MAG: C45 family autoproteolytic acyltransferase/hydrolase, partial [Thermoguttaceae bacterium]
LGSEFAYRFSRSFRIAAFGTSANFCVRRSLLRCLLFALGFWWLFAASVIAAETKYFQEGKFAGGELRYINDLPVLIVAGTPEQMGRQTAALTGDVVRTLIDYPKKFLSLANHRDKTWKKMISMAEELKPQIPADYRNELKAFADQAQIHNGTEVGLVANVLVDIYRNGLNCSSRIVQSSRSATGGPLFGRNLGFYTLGMLDHYSLVTVHRAKNKHAFVSIGFPGMAGCISGMNDAGLTLAVHDVFLSRDGAPTFNSKGVPYAFAFRRVLEECTTVDQAEKLLRSLERTTLVNLSICDLHDAAVFEMTPKTLAVRRGHDGLLFCTNHFRTPKLIMFAWCNRYPILQKIQRLKTIDIPDVAKKLDQVNMDLLTVQTMIFEPKPLVLHLAIGSCPSSALPLKKLELQPLFRP